jgi:aspartyl-tRNA(Asn)/glutamyl-tRNA(Gln) amidotransferase subunit A
MSTEPATWTIGELSGLLASGEMSPVALAESALEAIDAYDDTLKAFIDVYRDDALASAKRAAAETESGHHRGPLHGIPIAVKDNIFVAGKRTTMGSKIHADFIPDVDAGVTSRLADAAAVVVGKTNMHEYALGGTTDNPHWGTCRNPWDLTKTPGGSSGGSAVAVATGMAVAALGSDTSGSIRIPAALCGLVGFKPTYGRVSRFGVFPEAWTLDHVGPITRTVRDAALVLDAISGHDPRDPGSLHSPPTRLAGSLRDSCEGVVIGVEEDFWFTDIDDAIAASLREALRALERKGARVESVSVPRLRHTEYALTVIDTAETSTVHHANLRDRPQDYGDDVRLLLECGELPSAVDYLEAQQIRRALRRDLQETFERVDVLVGPTLGSRTQTIGDTFTLVNDEPVVAIDSMIRLVGPASLLGLPCLSVPCGLVDGLPVGMQIIGPALGEQKVLDVGHAFEQTRPLGDARPAAHLV